MKLISFPALITSIISFYVAAYHFSLFLHWRKNKENLYFSTLCLSIALYCIGSVGISYSNSIKESYIWAKLQYFMIPFIAISVSFFIFNFIKKKSTKQKIFFTALAISFLIFAIFDGRLTLSINRPLIRTFFLFSVEYKLYELELGLIIMIYYFIILISIFYFFILLIIYYIKQKEKEAIPVIIGLTFFFIGGLIDTLVSLNIITFPYVIQIGFLILILCMAYSLSQRFLKLHRTVESMNITLEEQIHEKTKELKEANKELMKTNKQLQGLDKLKNNFIANITHDFRSPLMGIMNISDIALKYDKTMDSENTERYKIIHNASLKLKMTIDRLLELAKMDAKGIKLNIKKINIISFLKNMINFYRSTLMMTKIKIIEKFPKKEITDFFCDEEKLEEILNNIISNAIKYVNPDTGKIIIEIKYKNIFLIISVKDNGIGIEKDKLKHIFKRFEQIPDGKSKYTGTGIGLSFCKQLIKYLKGNLSAKSGGKGKGAEFIIKLKTGKNVFNKKDYIDSDYKNKNIKVKTYKQLIELELSKKNKDDKIFTVFNDLNKKDEFNYKKAIILIIDDNINIQKIIMDYLINDGYKNFITASNGRLGLKAIFDYNPDLIICDYNMPNMNGEKLHNKLYEKPGFKNIPFIFLSAVADKNIIRDRFKKGAVGYLYKPVNEIELLTTVKNNLKKHMLFKKNENLNT